MAKSLYFIGIDQIYSILGQESGTISFVEHKTDQHDLVTEEYKMVVTKDTIIGDVVAADPEVAPVLMASGLHCLGCVLATGETIEEACYVHGIEVDKLVSDINGFFETKGENKADAEA